MFVSLFVLCTILHITSYHAPPLITSSPVGQNLMHSPHKSHLATTFRAGIYTIAPNGHASRHFLQPSQSSSIISTWPSSVISIASLGHASIHFGFLQCLQLIILSSPDSFRTVLIRAKLGLFTPSLIKEQTSSQMLQPVHEKGSI